MKTIFLSIGLEDTEHHTGNDRTKKDLREPIDKVVMQYCLNAIFQQAATYGHRLVLRDHPAIISLADIHMEAAKSKLVTVAEDMDAHDIARIHKPDIIFYLGGDQRMIADHQIFKHFASIKEVPLRGTGGATVLVENDLPEDRRESLDNGKRPDDFGFERIARILFRPRPAL